MEVPIIGYIVVIITVSIFLMAGIAILASTHGDMGCSDLSGNSTSGWQAACLKIQDQTTASFSLFVIILTVISAVVIILTIRILG